MMKKLTPVLIVNAIEPLLPLWDALGFSRTAEVPQGDRLGFVILQNGATELMYQTIDSVRADEPKVGDQFGRSGLFIEVDNLDAVAKLVPRNTDIVVERRLACRPCYERDRCPLEHWQCMVDITVEHVYEACRKRLLLTDARPSLQPAE